jgi:type II secretory pathway pseudopilin PulG
LTLLELVLVLALLVITFAIIFPIASAAWSQTRARAAADHLRGAYATARTHAVEDSRRYRLSYLPNKSNYRIAPDDPQFWSGGGADDNGSAFVLADALPDGFCFDLDPNSEKSGTPALPPESVSPSEYTTLVVFDVDGSASADRAIDLRKLPDDPPVTVVLRGLTGTATVRKPGKEAR